MVLFFMIYKSTLNNIQTSEKCRSPPQTTKKKQKKE